MREHTQIQGNKNEMKEKESIKTLRRRILS